VPHLLKVLLFSEDARLREAAGYLEAWDGRMEPDRVGATIFDVFFVHWVRAVVRERFEGDTAGLVAGGANGLAARLLEDDAIGWFSSGRRVEAIRGAMGTALDYLVSRLGPNMSTWQWGRLHVMPLRHILSGRGDLGRLLDSAGAPIRGDMTTVCNTGQGGAFEARTGANYRLIADFSDPLPTLWAVDASSQSGHPGSPHYADQFEGWAGGDYHALPLDRAAAEKEAVTRMILEP
jgi:penicillin amidase